jgi:cytochrome c-type biogenesis protein CcmE
MNKIHKRRLYYLGLFALGLSLAAGLILYALKQNINVFLTPAQLANTHFATDYHFRLGGMVKKNSIVRDKNSLSVKFIVSDLKSEVSVQYLGVLPDLFREGSGMIAEGSLNAQGIFIATQVLAKHDENYMPKNVYQALRQNSDGKKS